MERRAWLLERRAAVEAAYDAEAPTYDDHPYPAAVQPRFVERLVATCPPGGVVLDAPCGTGQYFPQIAAAGRRVVGIDQSVGMLEQARARRIAVALHQIGLQELRFEAEFDAVMTIDAMENVFPEDWPLVLANLHRAVRSGGHLYLTVEEVHESVVDGAFTALVARGLPVVRGEVIEGGATPYHYYPGRDRVLGWLEAEGLAVVEQDTEAQESWAYWHLLLRSPAKAASVALGAGSAAPRLQANFPTDQPATRRLAVEDVDPDLRGLARALPAAIFEKAPLRRSMNTAMGLIPRFGVQAGVRLRRVRSGDLRLRLYEPHGPRSAAALLWIHGGGYLANRPVLDDRLCSRVAGNLRLTVVSVDYRLAPEHPFPAGLDDCEAAWRWILRAAPRLGIDPGRIAVGGQSAGGGLAAALAQRIADSGGQQPAAQWLFSPMLDDRTAARLELDDVHHFIWTNELNRFGWRAYLGAEPGSAEVPPYAVPARREDVGGLPPAWIGVGDIDLFHDEVLAYADRLRDAGVETTLDVVPGAPHGFEAMPGGAPVAGPYNERADAWLADRLQPSAHPMSGGGTHA